MATNPNSIHVLVKIAKTFPKESVKQLYDTLVYNFESIACDKNGVCLIKAIFESVSDIATL